MVTMIRFNPHEDAHLLDALIQCYRDVFGDPPWNEWKKCPKCELKWSKKEAQELESTRHCGAEIVDFWPYEQVREDIFHEITPESSCWLAMDDEKVVGFCWGYPIKVSDLEEKLGISFSAQMHEMFGKHDIVAYQDDIGILTEYRGLKLAKELIKLRFEDFKNQGLAIGVFRTMTSPPSVTYLWYSQKLDYKVVAKYKDTDGRVIMARTLHDLVVS